MILRIVLSIITSYNIMLEKFENTKGVITINLRRDKQHNYQKKKDKRTNNDQQNITQKTIDRATGTQ